MKYIQFVKQCNNLCVQKIKSIEDIEIFQNQFLKFQIQLSPYEKITLKKILGNQHWFSFSTQKIRTSPNTTILWIFSDFCAPMFIHTAPGAGRGPKSGSSRASFKPPASLCIYVFFISRPRWPRSQPSRGRPCPISWLRRNPMHYRAARSFYGSRVVFWINVAWRVVKCAFASRAAFTAARIGLFNNWRVLEVFFGWKIWLVWRLEIFSIQVLFDHYIYIFFNMIL